MTEVFYGLALLACPLGMGAMMWIMMRGGHGRGSAPSVPESSELAQLRAQVEQLRAEQQGERSSTPGGMPSFPAQP